MARHAARTRRGAAWRGADRRGTLLPDARWPTRGRARLLRLSRRHSWLLWLLLLSALVHLALLLALLVTLPASEPRNAGEPASVDVVMLPPGAPELPPSPEPEPNPTTTEPPMPSEPLPLPPTPPSQPPPAEAPPAPPTPPQAEQLPLPPPPPPAPPQEAALRPLPPPPRPRPPPPPAFPRPIARSLTDLTLSTPGAAMPAPAPQPRQGINLALGPVARASNGAVPRNPTSTDTTVRVEGADLGPDWIRLLHEWWDRHGYYPRQAAEQGEDGTSRVRVVVDRSGRVHEVVLEMRSGSQWLDMGSLAIFRGAMLPPFPPSTPQNEATLHLTLNFILFRR